MVPGHGRREVLDGGPDELKTRGVQDILICCVDGLKGFPEAIEAVFPQTWVQTCIVHLIRQSLRYVPRRQYDQVVKDLRPIYTAVNAEAALAALEAFEDKWGSQIPVIGQAWRTAGSTSPRSSRSNQRCVACLHDQRDRSAEPSAPQSDQDQGQLPQRGRRPQARLPRDPERRTPMDADPRLDESPTRVQDPLRRPTARRDHQPCLHRNRTPPWAPRCPPESADLAFREGLGGHAGNWLPFPVNSRNEGVRRFESARSACNCSVPLVSGAGCPAVRRGRGR